MWRSKGLGASDAPVIMGVSPWTSRFQLWGYKTGLMTRPEPNQFAKVAMQRGHALEPIARKMYEELSGNLYPAVSFEHDTAPFMRASLDGYNLELNRVLEIKCPGKIDHAKAVAGIVPEKYYPQLQMQMLVSGAPISVYASWDGVSKDLAIVQLEADAEYMQFLYVELTMFWQMVQDRDLLKAMRELNKQPVNVLDNDGFTKVEG